MNQDLCHSNILIPSQFWYYLAIWRYTVFILLFHFSVFLDPKSGDQTWLCEESRDYLTTYLQERTHVQCTSYQHCDVVSVGISLASNILNDIANFSIYPIFLDLPQIYLWTYPNHLVGCSYATVSLLHQPAYRNYGCQCTIFWINPFHWVTIKSCMAYQGGYISHSISKHIPLNHCKITKSKSLYHIPSFHQFISP